MFKPFLEKANKKKKMSAKKLRLKKAMEFYKAEHIKRESTPQSTPMKSQLISNNADDDNKSLHVKAEKLGQLLFPKRVCAARSHVPTACTFSPKPSRKTHQSFRNSATS